MYIVFLLRILLYVIVIIVWSMDITALSVNVNVQCLMIEVQVYMNQQAFFDNKSVFGRMVKCPDVFDFRGFEASMRSVFGNECITVYKCSGV